MCRQDVHQVLPLLSWDLWRTFTCYRWVRLSDLSWTMKPFYQELEVSNGCRSLARPFLCCVRSTQGVAVSVFLEKGCLK